MIEIEMLKRKLHSAISKSNDEQIIFLCNLYQIPLEPLSCDYKIQLDFFRERKVK